MILSHANLSNNGQFSFLSVALHFVDDLSRRECVQEEEVFTIEAVVFGAIPNIKNNILIVFIFIHANCQTRTFSAENCHTQNTKFNQKYYHD